MPTRQASSGRNMSTYYACAAQLCIYAMPAYFWTSLLPQGAGAIQNVNIDVIEYWVSTRKLHHVAMARKVTLQPII